MEDAIEGVNKGFHIFPLYSYYIIGMTVRTDKTNGAIFE